MGLLPPHGGTLKELFLPATAADAEKRNTRDYPSWDLTSQQLCDLELLLCGAFSPLEGFMGRADYERVLSEMRLADGTLWPIPVTLDVTEEFAAHLHPSARIALRDPEGVALAVLVITEMWRPDKEHEALAVYGTRDRAHPAVTHLHARAGTVYVAGKVLGLAPAPHYDFKHLRNTPSELRAYFRKRGWNSVVAFHTRSPMHRVHSELAFRAAQKCEANLLIHPVIGVTKPGDVDHFTRVRCYEQVLRRFPEQTTMLSLLPLAMRMGGPREALWHAIIRKNFGCTHFVVGHDHAGPGRDSNGHDFYAPYAAQELYAAHQEELGIEMVPFQDVVYVRERGEYVSVNQVANGESVLALSWPDLKRRLQEGIDVPEWFTFPEVATELRKTYRPRHQQGFTIFLTGLSGAGKSTIANALTVKLLEMGGRPVTLLDGDVVRKHLSSELGFSKEHRDLNIRRIGYVASEITKNGGVAICAPIAPYEATRRDVRDMIAGCGGFIEVYVSTPIAVCESRDRKGLYAKARAGLLKGFTGVDDPYEVPKDPELVIDASASTVDEEVQKILLKLENMGYLR